MDRRGKYSLIIACILSFIIILTRIVPTRNLQSKLDFQNYDKVMKQAQNLHLAATQDTNILMALLHINTALSKLDTIEQLSSVNDLARECKVDYSSLRTTIDTYHDKVLQGFETQAPQLALKRSYDIKDVI